MNRLEKFVALEIALICIMLSCGITCEVFGLEALGYVAGGGAIICFLVVIYVLVRCIASPRGFEWLGDE